MAVESVGVALLSSFLGVAFDRLASREVLDFFRGRKLNDALLKRFNIMLLSINVVADDAEQKQIKNKNVKAWLDAVKDAVMDAEDLLDEIDYEVTKCKLDAESQARATKVWNFFNSSVSSFDKGIESRMREILDNLEYLASKKDILGLKEASGSSVGSGRQVSQKLPTTSLVGETVIYGRDDDKEKIFNWLMSDVQNDKQLSIISLVGMGGMGKTTLAQHLFNDRRIEGGFDIKAWVCVSDDFDVLRVTRAILEEISKSNDDTREINLLQVKLKEKLTGKKFLLVLDDVWNENHMQWEALQTPFIYGAKGSKILVTTRSKRVASTMRSSKTHQLEQLQEEHCWQLFSQHAFFQDENAQLNPEFKEIGMKIVEKCKGLPLALKTIGSLLYTKSSVWEWESILTSKIWDLPEEDSNIIPALRLSYHHLPSHLKRCFAYCALFPKDYLFVKEHLILLWMAENLIQCPHKSKNMEEVGEQYFDDLLSRSFFQQSSRYKIAFVMHDLLNDLAKYICGDFCFRLEVEEAQNISNTTRHFSFLKSSYDVSKRFEALHKAKKLRSFLPLTVDPFGIYGWRYMSHSLVYDLFSKFKFLHVLSLAGYKNVTELPDTIGNLKNLRYLDLSRTLITKLPDSTCLLYNLQILKLESCSFLEELPWNLHKLANLCYLDFSGTKVTKMPLHFGKLKNLQVLNPFFVGKGSESNIHHLGELNLHGTLSILELQNIVNPLDALAANLKNKAHLMKLKLKWSTINDESKKEREVLERLQPSKNLKELSIKNYGGTQFPNWFEEKSLSNVVSLKLRNCKNCVLLPPLGVLPSLKNLSIGGFHGIVSIGSEFYGSSSSSTFSFASLETLEFWDMKEWDEWECKNVNGTFPCLRRLLIKNCPKLKEHLPEELSFLTELTIYNCEQLVASSPKAPTIHKLTLHNCRVQFDYLPSSLKVLNIGGHCMEGSLLERIERITSHASLETLNIYYLPAIHIPLSHCYNFLVELFIESSCDSLRIFPLDSFPKLRSFTLHMCTNLEMISQEHAHNHMSLTSLFISRCPKFLSFPLGGLSAPRLELFQINRLENLKSLPDCMDILLPSLNEIDIWNCPQLESVCNGGFPSNIRKLSLTNCPQLNASLKRAFGTNCFLAELCIEGMGVESFPDEGLLPFSLTSLVIKSSKLEKLDYKGLCHLSSLTKLFLIDCPKLQCLPEEGLPKSISTLVINGNCSLLKLRCQKPKGEDWGKIAHIKQVEIDFDLIT